MGILNSSIIPKSRIFCNVGHAQHANLYMLFGHISAMMQFPTTPHRMAGDIT